MYAYVIPLAFSKYALTFEFQKFNEKAKFNEYKYNFFLSKALLQRETHSKEKICNTPENITFCRLILQNFENSECENIIINYA